MQRASLFIDAEGVDMQQSWEARVLEQRRLAEIGQAIGGNKEKYIIGTWSQDLGGWGAIYPDWNIVINSALDLKLCNLIPREYVPLSSTDYVDDPEDRGVLVYYDMKDGQLSSFQCVFTMGYHTPVVEVYSGPGTCVMKTVPEFIEMVRNAYLSIETQRGSVPKFFAEQMRLADEQKRTIEPVVERFDPAQIDHTLDQVFDPKNLEGRFQLQKEQEFPQELKPLFQAFLLRLAAFWREATHTSRSNADLWGLLEELVGQLNRAQLGIQVHFDKSEEMTRLVPSAVEDAAAEGLVAELNSPMAKHVVWIGMAVGKLYLGAKTEYRRTPVSNSPIPFTR